MHFPLDLVKRAFIFLCVSVYFMQAVEEKERIVFYTEEKANNQLFVHRIDIINGMRQEVHSINGQTVAPAEYEDALITAESEERRKERQHVQETKLKTYDLYYKARTKISKNELKPLLAQLESETKKLEDARLKPYLSFSPETIGSPEELHTITSMLIPQARKLLDEPFEAINFGHFNHIKNEMNRALPRVQDMCNATLDSAITKADETKLLKDILELFA